MTSTAASPRCLVDLYTQGAHCCSITLILRWDAAAHRYRSRLVYWGNYGMKLADLDHDGLPELSAFDERFLYTYTAYVFSAAPPQIFDYRQGKLVDVTRKFPAEIRKNAAYALRQFVHLKKAATGFDSRAFVAVYVADQYLLGRPDLAKKALDDALAKGILYRGKAYLGTPAGAAFVAQLNRDLRKWGYITERHRRTRSTRRAGRSPACLLPRPTRRGRTVRCSSTPARPTSSRTARSPAPCSTRSRSSSGGSTSCRARRSVILICRHGESSSLAAAQLVQMGFHEAADVIGGAEAWRAAGLPVVDAGAGDQSV